MKGYESIRAVATFSSHSEQGDLILIMVCMLVRVITTLTWLGGCFMLTTLLYCLCFTMSDKTEMLI